MGRTLTDVKEAALAKAYGEKAKLDIGNGFVTTLSMSLLGSST